MKYNAYFCEIKQCLPLMNSTGCQEITQKMPLVSVLMPAYNQAEYIKEALDSLLKQTYRNWEVAVVDDGSPDNVREIVEGYSRKDSRIRFYHTDNYGLSHARNYAASKTSGELIIPLDADDIFHQDYIKECVKVFLQNPETSVVYGQWEFFGASNKTPALNWKGYISLLVSNAIYCSGMYRRAAFEQAGGYDEKIPYGYEDWEMWIRMLNSDSIVIQIPRPLFRYRIKKQSMSTICNKEEHLKLTREYIFNRHRDKYLSYFPDFISIIQELDYKRYRVEKWKKRSFFSRLWYAVTGRF